MNALFWAIVLLVIALELIQRSITKNKKEIIIMVSALFCLYIGGYTLHRYTLDGSVPRKTFHDQLKKTYSNTTQFIQTAYSRTYTALSKSIKEVIH